MSQNVGFMGIGNMGYGMVKNLLEKGFSVLAYDIDSEKLNSIRKFGAQIVKSIQDIKNVEIVILCLPHPDISQQIISTLIQNKVKAIIETSTITPENSLSFKQQIEIKQINYLCAPMLAGKQMAFDGKINFIVEGKKTIFDKYLNLFDAMGKASYLGDVPNATLAKLAYNICRYSNVVTAIEVINFLKKYSKNLAPIYEVIADGSLDNFGQVWKQEMGEVAIENKKYKFAGNKVPIKDLSLIIKMTKDKKLRNGLYEEIKKIYELL